MPRNVFGENSHYKFRDQDPVINAMRTIWKASGLNLHQLADKLHMCPSTFHSWFVTAKTRSPRHESVQIFYNGFGIEYGAKSNLRVIVSEIKRSNKKAA